MEQTDFTNLTSSMHTEICEHTELLRMALLVNDNDSGKRLRLMEHFGGIEGGKDTELFGWCRLQ